MDVITYPGLKLIVGLTQNGGHFADDRNIFRCIFMNEKFCILIRISLKIVHKGQIGSDNGVAPFRRQAIIWTNADTIHWRIYATLGGDELNTFCY